MFSQAFVTSVLFGVNSVPEDTLVKSLRKYLATDEEEIVMKALNREIDDILEEQEAQALIELFYGVT